MITAAASSRPSMPLLPSKLHAPQIGGRPLLERKAQLEQLLRASAQPLVVLSAPAGFGKSTLLAQFRQHLLEQGNLVAWLSCDEQDSEPPRLLQYLIAAIGTQLPGFAEQLAQRQSFDRGSLEQALLLELERLPQTLYLILDDLPVMGNRPLENFLLDLIGQMPSQVHLLMAMRARPTLLEAASARGAAVPAVWISADQLQLSAQECERYVRRIKQLALGDAEIAQLHGITEGWLAALHLATLGLARSGDGASFLAGFSGCERNIADYLAEDVLDKLPPEVQQFLEQTSLLDEFNAELCNVLTGRSDSQALLDRLQREQLFMLPLDTRGRWYRYHRLFAECLRGRLQQRGDSSHLTQAAARWWDARKGTERAIEYGLRGRDYRFAAQVLEREGASLIARNQTYRVLSLIERIPTEVIGEYPVFQVFYAWHLALEQRLAEAEALFDQVSGHLMQGRLQPVHLQPGELLALAQVLKALILLYQDKLEACLEITGQWLARVPEHQAVFRASLACVHTAAHSLRGDYAEADQAIAMARTSVEQSDSAYLQVIASLIEALICKERGQLARARVLIEQARLRAQQVFKDNSRVAGPLALAYADLLYEQNQAEAILADLPQACSWRDVATPIELISRGKLVMARARFYSGDGEGALAELDQWLNSIQRGGCERIYALALCSKATFLLWLRRVGEAERSCLQLKAQLSQLPVQRYSDTRVAQVLAEARLALCERRHSMAQQALAGCLEEQTGAHQCDARLRLSLLLAVANWRNGQAGKAFDLLRATVEEAWQRGYRRMMLDDALWLLPLCSAWAEAEPQGAAAWGELIQQMHEQCARLAIDPQKLDDHQQVNLREQDILRFVAAGLSNREIAQSLHLSEATIKWHLHNLFAKLGVRSRTQAVLKGKQVGLLSEA